MPLRETAKQRAKRIDGRVLDGSRWLERGRFLLAGVAAIVAIGWWGAGNPFSPGRRLGFAGPRRGRSFNLGERLQRVSYRLSSDPRRCAADIERSAIGGRSEMPEVPSRGAPKMTRSARSDIML